MPLNEHIWNIVNLSHLLNITTDALHQCIYTDNITTNITIIISYVMYHKFSYYTFSDIAP